MSDFRAAFRALQKSPAFTLVAVITTAVGIGANTTLFSVYDRLVLNPVTIPRPSTLVAIWTNNPQLNFNAPALAWPRYEDIRDHARSFASLGISASDNFTLAGNGEPQQLNGQRVGASFFPTLGILPARGRNFTAGEDVPNGPAVCVISHELWQTRFGGREQIVGEIITLNGQPWQVVGILPPHLSPPFSQVQVFAAQVVRMIMRSGLRLVAIGLGLGLAAAAGAARVIQTLLFDVRPLEPLVYAGVATTFALVASFACLLPSLRASRIDPIIALRG